MPKTMPKTLRELVESLKDRQATAISWKKDGKGERQEMSFQELYKDINDYGRGFLELGLEKGDRVAVFSKNIPEWSGITLGINNAGLISVPRGEDSTIQEINYILKHSKAKVVIVDNEKTLEKIKEEVHPDLETILSIEEISGVRNIKELKDNPGNKKLPKMNAYDTARIIYTSGTTGIPKGVQITHWNLMSNIEAILKRIEITEQDKTISILPAWHALDGILKDCALKAGAETFYSTLKYLRRDIKEEKPTILLSVPRLWEHIYEGLEEKIRKSKFRNAVFNKLKNPAVEYSKGNKTIFNFVSNLIMEKICFSKLRQELGGNLRFAISGGGPLSTKLEDFFTASKIEILEGYGLTEASPVVSVRIPGVDARYTVGPLLDGIEMKIINPETGEKLEKTQRGIIYIKGPNVMKGYYRDFESTKKVLQKSWLDTRDIGYMNHEGNLVILDRADNMIILSSGENVWPSRIEQRLKESPYISSAILFGQGWKGLGALIEPNFEKLQYPNVKNPETIELYNKEISRLTETREFKSYERIKAFALVQQHFEVGKELTSTQKPKKREIEKRYSWLIKEMQEKINGKH